MLARQNPGQLIAVLLEQFDVAQHDPGPLDGWGVSPFGKRLRRRLHDSVNIRGIAQWRPGNDLAR